jgi:hypothetical protein
MVSQMDDKSTEKIRLVVIYLLKTRDECDKVK